MEGQKNKELAKTKDTLADVQKVYDALKKKYSEDVEQMRRVSDEEYQARADKVRDLEGSTR